MNKIEFFSYSPDIQSIIKGLILSKSLFVSTIVWGEPHTGKKSLVSSIFSKTILVDGEDTETLQETLRDNNEIVIYNFETIQNLQSLELENKRIIAIANYDRIPISVENYFAFIYNMPPLRKRLDDVKFFVKKFSKELKEDLKIKGDIDIDVKNIDLSQNFKSLKISLHRELIKKTLSDKDIEEILFNYFYKKIDGKNAYRENLGIYERPLIKAGLKKFKSQLKLSGILGLNRNTLRKKIYEQGIN